MTAPVHDGIPDLLGAYVDGELPDALAAQVRGHLDACASCRAALGVQRSVRARLAAVPVAHVPAELDRRLSDAVDAAAATGGPPGARRPRRRPVRLAAWSGWAAAAALAVALLVTRLPATAPRPAAPQVPMVASALVDYRASVARELPPGCDAPGASPLDGPPLRAPDAHVVSCWATTLQGHPAAAWAYRWRDQVVVAYVVPESLFFRQPAVREAVQREGRFLATDGREGVVAWPEEDRGIVLVGEDAPARLESLRF